MRIGCASEKWYRVTFYDADCTTKTFNAGVKFVLSPVPSKLMSHFIALQANARAVSECPICMVAFTMVKAQVCNLSSNNAERYFTLKQSTSLLFISMLLCRCY